MKRIHRAIIAKLRSASLYKYLSAEPANACTWPQTQAKQSKTTHTMASLPLGISNLLPCIPLLILLILLPCIPLLILLILLPCIPLLILLILDSSSSCEAENIMYPRYNLSSGSFLAYGHSYLFRMDRDVVLYGHSSWATGTNTPVLATSYLGRAAAAVRMIEDTNTLDHGETLPSEEFLAYGNNYILKMQSDCNLVLSDAGVKLWESGTAGLAQNCSCTLQLNGTLTINGADGSRIRPSAGVEIICVCVLQ
ncbi:hypothetical protein ACLOJK_040043 [Asimina triloba]